MSRRLALVLLCAAVAGCGDGVGSPERARARFDATLAWVRTSLERDNARIESAFLADGTDASGRPGQFVCGIAREFLGGRRAFMSPALEEGTRELSTTALDSRDQRSWWQNGCRTPARDAAGEEVRFEEPAQPSLQAAAPVAGTETAEAPAPAEASTGDKDPAQ